jgi:hypothetical protein
MPGSDDHPLRRGFREGTGGQDGAFVPGQGPFVRQTLEPYWGETWNTNARSMGVDADVWIRRRFYDSSKKGGELFDMANYLAAT